jgi:hypothetical protein
LRREALKYLKSYLKFCLTFQTESIPAAGLSIARQYLYHLLWSTSSNILPTCAKVEVSPVISDSYILAPYYRPRYQDYLLPDSREAYLETARDPML